MLSLTCTTHSLDGHQMLIEVFLHDTCLLIVYTVGTVHKISSVLQVITVSIIVHAQHHMSSSESLITSYFIFVIIYLMVVVFQSHTCTHLNFTSLLEQQAVSPCELMFANEAMYPLDVIKRVQQTLTNPNTLGLMVIQIQEKFTLLKYVHCTY